MGRTDVLGRVRQIVAVTAMGLRAIPDRLGASLVIVIGMALVVAVSISILSMSVGFMRTVHNTGRIDRVIVLSKGSQFEFASEISRDNVPTIADAPGIKIGGDGKPIVSAEYLAAVLLTKKSDGLDAYVSLRGIGPQAFALRPEIKLVSGRMFQSARHELIVGQSALAQFAGLEVGAQVPLQDGDWTITGSFESHGDEHESELLADSETVLSAMRANTFHSVTAMLERPESLEQFQTALTTNPTLAVDVTRETEFLASQSKYLNTFLTMIAYVVGGIMGLGATFGIGGVACVGGLGSRDRRHRCVDRIQWKSSRGRRPGIQACRDTGPDRTGARICLHAGICRRLIPCDSRRKAPRRGRIAGHLNLRNSPRGHRLDASRRGRPGQT